MVCKPLVSKRKRDGVVRPSNGNEQDIIAPIEEEFDDFDDGSETAEMEDKWDELANKYEDLEKKVHEYLDDENIANARNFPMIRSPPTMTKEQWARHQITHTHLMNPDADIV